MQFLPANFTELTELGENLFASGKRNLEKKASKKLTDAMFGKTMAAINTGSAQNALSGNLNANIDNISKTSLSVQMKQKELAQDIEKTIGSTSDSKFSRLELIQLREQLSKKGINSERLERLTPLIDSGKSFSLKEIHMALNGGEVGDLDMNIPADLTDTELKQLRTFLGKLGFGPENVEKLIADIDEGNEIDAWKAIENKLINSPDFINVCPEDINALARAFKLTVDQREALQKMFSQETEMQSAALLKGLNLINTEMENRASSDLLLNDGKALTEAAAETLKLSKEKTEVVDKSNNKESQAAQQMNARINDTVTSKGDALPKAAANSDNKDAQQGVGAQQNNLNEEYSSDKQSQESSKDNQNSLANRQQTKAEKSASQETANNDSFLNKVITADPSLLGSSQAKAGESASRNQTTAFTNQVFSQVETGILRNLQDGVKQLTLQLDPGDLGTLTLVLSVKEKEVSAVIRADNPETAKVIEDQLHKIRQSLENQGLKVENLEVQSNINNNNAKQQWEGFAQHNFQQEEREYRERARLLNRLRHSDDTMAHNLQNSMESTAHAANISSSELYIVA